MELATETRTETEQDLTHLELAVAAAVAQCVADEKQRDDDAPVREAYAAAKAKAATTAARKVAKALSEWTNPSEINPVRVARVWSAALAGAEIADIRFALKADRSGLENVKISTRYGGCSRGKCWGRDANTHWAEKDGGSVYLTEGKWMVGSDDGYSRKETPVKWVVKRIGAYLFAA